LRLVRSVGLQGHLRAHFGGEHHDAQDALAVHLEPFPLDEDVGSELARRLHECGAGAGVQAETVLDRDRLFHHRRFVAP